MDVSPCQFNLHGPRDCHNSSSSSSTYEPLSCPCYLLLIDSSKYVFMHDWLLHRQLPLVSLCSILLYTTAYISQYCPRYRNQQVQYLFLRTRTRTRTRRTQEEQPGVDEIIGFAQTFIELDFHVITKNGPS